MESWKKSHVYVWDQEKLKFVLFRICDKLKIVPNMEIISKFYLKIILHYFILCIFPTLKKQL